MTIRSTDEISRSSQAELFKEYSTSTKGLTEEEALSRLQHYGRNRLKRKQDWFWIRLLGNQFNNALVWILLVAAALAYGFGETRDMVIILIIVGVNTAMGFFQEFKAERIIQKIRNLTSDKALIIRNGEKKEIDSRFLVPGDIVSITSGDNVPADGYLIEEYDLYINDFIFTGESTPNKKSVGISKGDTHSLGEMDNMVFMGSMVTRGEGIFIVTATGMATELGKIAGQAATVHSDETPLQKKLRALGWEVTVLSLLIAAIVIVCGRLFGVSWFETFLFALALAVSVVPEGLPAAMSVSLSLGMKRLLTSNVLAKKLAAVETLGSVSVICTDKTGTITRNELMVTDIILGTERSIKVDGEGFKPKGNFFHENQKINVRNEGEPFLRDLDTILKIGVLCNDAELVRKDGKDQIIGDPTEGAIIVAAKKFNLKTARYLAKEKKIGENPFSSDRMRMSVIYKNKSTIAYVKGSPDVLLARCQNILVDGQIRMFNEEDREKVIERYNQMSAQALRVLAFAYRDLAGVPTGQLSDESEKDLVWVGMMGMIDPPRKDAAKAISSCQKAGIKVIMITGDYEVTAKAIARNVGLLSGKNAELVISGKQLDTMSDELILDSVKRNEVVFARINPDQKLRIATLLKKDGMIIAMTGDGVNDALALKKADIGVAMGVIGTDVAKEAGDMILLDDNFASIVKAIKEGRVIYQNIKKFVHYVFTSNASELFTVVIGVFLSLPSPLTAIQILATDLGTDLFPSFALGIDPPEPHVMRNSPYDPNEKVVNRRGFWRIIYLGFLMASCAVIVFLISMYRGGWKWGTPIDKDSLLYIQSTTATYAVISMTQMANLFQSRSEILSAFTVGLFKNRYALVALVTSVAMLFCFMYIPVLSESLKIYPISGKDWFAVIISVGFVFWMEELRKWYLRRKMAAA